MGCLTELKNAVTCIDSSLIGEEINLLACSRNKIYVIKKKSHSRNI